MLSYRFIALAPNTPATAEATAMTTLRIISQRDFFIAIILYTSFPNAFKWLVTSRKLSFYFKARACLDPLFRFNLPVSVQVRTEIPVSAHPAGGEALLQLVHQQAEGGALFRCPCVCRASPAVQTAFIADSDTRRIESLHVCPCLLYTSPSPRDS